MRHRLAPLAARIAPLVLPPSMASFALALALGIGLAGALLLAAPETVSAVVGAIASLVTQAEATSAP